jgi:hypothetical protein
VEGVFSDVALLTVMHPTSWKVNSANFAITEVYEVRLAASAARLVIESIKNYTSLDDFPDRTRR